MNFLKQLVKIINLIQDNQISNEFFQEYIKKMNECDSIESEELKDLYKAHFKSKKKIYKIYNIIVIFKFPI
jgi:uncharacterized protein Yka (UPF0111/DUF47 family)